MSVLSEILEAAKRTRRYLRKKKRWILRYKLNRDYCQQYCGQNHVTLISSNCLGGIIYNSLGLEFCSPTINMYIKPADFVVLVKNFEKFLNPVSFELVKDEMLSYPVVRITTNDGLNITLYCVHYHSLEEVEMKWIERSKRVNMNNIRLMMCERDGCRYEDIVNFDQLPYKKVVFVHKPMPEIKSAVYLKNTEESQAESIIDLTQFENWLSGRRLIDRYDFVHFMED